MQNKKILMWIVIALLLVVDFLAFHDFFEQHTLRDWLTLLASVLTFGYFFLERK